MKLYVKVSEDDLELPEAVAESGADGYHTNPNSAARTRKYILAINVDIISDFTLKISVLTAERT